MEPPISLMFKISNIDLLFGLIKRLWPVWALGSKHCGSGMGDRIKKNKANDETILTTLPPPHSPLSIFFRKKYLLGEEFVKIR